MDSLLPVDIASRWVHVGTAIVLVGGSVFTRFVLMPAAAGLPDAEHAAFRERIRGGWSKVVNAGVALLLLSGLYNFMRALNPRPTPLYHALIGTKILLSFAVFFLASALSGRSAAFEGIRKNSRKWLGITIALAAVVVALGGVARVVGRTKPASDPQTSQSAPPSTAAEATSSAD